MQRRWAIVVVGAGTVALLFLIFTGGGFYLLPDAVRSRIAPLEAAAGARDTDAVCRIAGEMRVRRVPKGIARQVVDIGDACAGRVAGARESVPAKARNLAADLRRLEDVPGTGAYAALIAAVLVVAAGVTALLVLGVRRRQRRAMADFDVKS